MMLFHCCNETPLSELVGKFFVIFARYPGHKNLYNNLMNHKGYHDWGEESDSHWG